MHEDTRPEIVRATDEAGEAIVKIPLDRHGRHHATLYEADFDRIRSEGVGLPWFAVVAGKGHRYVRAYQRGVTGQQITVARAVLQAGPKENVRYVTGDRLDLRPWNLQIAKGNAKRRDLALCGAAGEAGAAA